MPDVIGIDHIYLAVSDLTRSERFYDVVMTTLGFRKNEPIIAGERHVQYFNREFGYVLRPARGDARHDPYSPGLHHMCLRVESEEQVSEVVTLLRAHGIVIADASFYPEYAPDYFACFLTDPDGIRLEITNYRRERRERREHWEKQVR